MDYQTTLFESPALDPASLAVTQRTQLDGGAWIDVRRDWLPDADDVFATMIREVPWRAERRQMYDRIVDVPRLVHNYLAGHPLPHVTLDLARETLSSLPTRARRAVRHRGLLLLPRRPRLGRLAR